MNTTTSTDQLDPSVAVGEAGRFVVAWLDHVGYGQQRIFARRFLSDASPVGNDYQVNTYTSGAKFAPDVGSAPDGSFVVVWSSEGSNGTDDDYTSIQRRRFAADGTPLEEDTQVNETTNWFQAAPRVDVAPGGDFVVVWASGYFNSLTIRGRVFDAAGMPSTDDFRVSSYIGGSEFAPDVAWLPDGGFLVTWESSESPGTDHAQTSIQARRFDSIGTPVADQFQVNAYTSSWQVSPALAVADDGSAAVVFSSGGSPGGDPGGGSVLTRRIGKDGSPVGSDQQVNLLGVGRQRYAAVATQPHGAALIAWMTEDSSDSDRAIALRGLHTAPLQCDGFESGDTAAWDLAVP